MGWEIRGQIGPHTRSGYDGTGWLWEIGRGDDCRRVLVEITGSALSSASLPEETREAIETEGRSEVERVASFDDPPRIVTCGTTGCRDIAGDEVEGA
jgi:hypothetical protein